MIKESVTFSNRNWVLLFSMVGERYWKRGLSDSYMNDRGYESSFPIILSLFLIILLTKDHVIIFSAVVIDSPLQVTTCFSSFCFDQGAISFTWAKMAKQILLSLTQQRRIPIPEILISASAWKHANVVFKKFKNLYFKEKKEALIYRPKTARDKSMWVVLLTYSRIGFAKTRFCIAFYYLHTTTTCKLHTIFIWRRKKERFLAIR